MSRIQLLMGASMILVATGARAEEEAAPAPGETSTATPEASAPPATGAEAPADTAAPTATADAAAERSLTWRAFVSTAYIYNFTYPGRKNDISGTRPFDYQYNSINLDVAQLSLRYDAVQGGQAGFRIDVNAGYTIPGRTFSVGTFAIGFDLLQAYATYIFDIGRGLRLDAGKMVTHMGAELIEGVDGYNLNYSRSMIFFNTIPFTHLAAKLSYSFADSVSAMLMVTNGADIAIDNNNGKGIGAQVVVTPVSALAIYLNWLMSAQQAGDDDSWRQFIDVVANIKPTDDFTININFDYTSEADALGPDLSRNQLGIAGILAYAFNDTFSVAVRGEFWNSGLPGASGDDVTYIGLTLTPTITLAGHFALRPELRMDMASEDIIWVSGPNGVPGTQLKGSQITGALNIVAWY